MFSAQEQPRPKPSTHVVWRSLILLSFLMLAGTPGAQAARLPAFNADRLPASTSSRLRLAEEYHEGKPGRLFARHLSQTESLTCYQITDVGSITCSTTETLYCLTSPDTGFTAYLLENGGTCSTEAPYVACCTSSGSNPATNPTNPSGPSEPNDNGCDYACQQTEGQEAETEEEDEEAANNTLLSEEESSGVYTYGG